MSLSIRLWLVGAATAAAIGLVFWLLRSHSAERSATPERLEDRLEGSPVRFHMALRQRLAMDGEAFAARLERARESPRAADALARSLLEAARGLSEDEHPDYADQPVLEYFGAPGLDRALDRLHLVLAMLWSEGGSVSERIPEYTLLYEASELDLESLDEAHRSLAVAAQAYAYAAGGYCTLVRPLAEPSAEISPEALQGWGFESDEDRAEAARTLSHLERLLIDGSLACCAVRQERTVDTARLLERSIEDAVQLGVAGERVPLLRAWAALLRGDREAARAALAEVDTERLSPEDFRRKKTIRSAIATPGEDAAQRALMGAVDRQWLSRLIVAGAVEALAETHLAAMLRDSEAARAAQRFVESELALVAAARRVDPFFDQAAARRSAPSPTLPATVAPALAFTPR